MSEQRRKKAENRAIGTRLREIRIASGMSQAAFAELLDISDDHYRRLESGLTGLTLEKIRVLHERLYVDPTYLLTGERRVDFNLETYLANCTMEEQAQLFRRSFEYFYRTFIESE